MSTSMVVHCATHTMNDSYASHPFLHAIHVLSLSLLSLCPMSTSMVVHCATHTINGNYTSHPFLHAIHVLSLSLLSLSCFLFLSCPHLHSATVIPIPESSTRCPPASLHPTLDGLYAGLLASHPFQRRSIRSPTRFSFFSRNRAVLLIYFSLLLSRDIELHPGPCTHLSISIATLNI